MLMASQWRSTVFGRGSELGLTAAHGSGPKSRR